MQWNDSEPKTNIRQQTVSGILWMAGARFGTQVIDQVFTIVLLRILAPSDFGLIAMAAVFTALFNLFSDMGISRAVIQRPDVDDEYLSTAFWGNFTSGVVLFAVAVVGAEFIARFYRQPLVAPVFAALSLRFVLAGMNATQGALLTREMRFSTITVRNIISVIVGGAVGVGVALAGGGVWSLVGQALVTAFTRTVVLWVATPWRPAFRFSWQKFRDLWYFGSRVLGGQVFSHVIKQSDNLLIGRILGPTLLGYYAFGYGMFLSPLVDVGLIVGRVIFPAFSSIQQDLGRFRRGFLMATTYVTLFTLPALVGLFLVAPDLIPVLFGPNWLPSVPVVRVLLIAAMLQFPTTLWTTVFMAKGRPDWLLKWGFVSVCLYVPAFWIGLRWGIVGVATGYTISTAVLIPVQLQLVRRLVGFRMRDYAGSVQGVVAASAFMALCVLLTQWFLTGQDAPLLIRLAAAVTVGVAAYVVAVALIQRDLITGLVQMVADLRRPRRHPRLAKDAV